MKAVKSCDLCAAGSRRQGCVTAAPFVWRAQHHGKIDFSPNPQFIPSYWLQLSKLQDIAPDGVDLDAEEEEEGRRSGVENNTEDGFENDALRDDGTGDYPDESDEAQDGMQDNPDEMAEADGMPDNPDDEMAEADGIGETPVDDLDGNPEDGNAGTQAGSKAPRLLHLPLSRIRTIMKTDPDVHLINAEAAALVAKATELFVGRVAKEAAKHTTAARRKVIQKKDFDAVLDVLDQMVFLEGALDWS